MIKSHNRCCLYLFVFFLAEALCLAATGPNVLIDSGFERSGATEFFGWTNTSVDGAVAEPDSTVFRSGAKSAKFMMIAGSKAELSSSKIPVSSGEKVSFRIWYKTALTANGSQYLFVRGVNSAGVESELQRVYEDVQPAEWKELGFSELVIPAGIEQIYLRFMTARTCVGSIWIDDCKLQFVGEQGAPQNPPVVFQAERRSETSAALSWSAPGGMLPAGGYRIYRAEGYAVLPDTASVLADVAALDYLDNSVEAGRFYAYLVTAKDNLRFESLPSNSVTITDAVRYPENMVKNGDFQIRDANNFAEDWDPDRVPEKSSLDHWIACSEFPSLKILGTGDSLGKEVRVRQLIRVKPNTEYVLSLMVRGEEIEGKAQVTILASGGGGTTLSFFIGNKSFAWKEISTVYTTGPTADKVYLLLFLNSNTTGTFWADDIVMYEAGSAVGALPQSPIIDGKRLSKTGQVELTIDEQHYPGVISSLKEYRVYRSQTPNFVPDSEGTLIKRLLPGKVKYVDQAAASGEKFYYCIVAVDSLGLESAPSNYVEAPALTAVSGTVVSNLGGAVSGVRVKLENIEAETDAAGSFRIDQLLPGLFTVRFECSSYRKREFEITVSEAGYSFSEPVVLIFDQVPPNAPTMSTAAGNVGRIDLHWTAPSLAQGDEAVGDYAYRIYRSRNSDNIQSPENLVAEGVGGLSWSDLDLQWDVEYYYAVQSADLAFNLSGLSELASAQAVTPMSITTYAPQPEEVILNERPHFKWLPVNDDSVGGYLLEVSRSDDFSHRWLSKTVTGASDYYVSEQISDGVWYWRVRTLYQSGAKGSWTMPANFTLLNSQPGDAKVPYLNIEPRLYSPGGEPCKIDLAFNDPCTVTINVYSLAGDLIKVIAQNTPVPSGISHFQWNGTDNFGRFLPNGLYLVRVTYKGENMGKVVIGKVAVFR